MVIVNPNNVKHWIFVEHDLLEWKWSLDLQSHTRVYLWYLVNVICDAAII
jgi:hypothetical protein